MKKLLTAKSLSLLMLLSLLGGKAEAGRHSDDGYVSESRDCCMSSCYECGCNPLYCGAWDLQIQGGANFTTWRNRGPIYGIECGQAASTGQLTTVFATGPSFKDLFKTPWTVGGQVGYHMSDNTRVYVEFDYSQTKGKSNVLTESIVTLTSINFYPNKYKFFEAYAGARYYWDRWCDRVSFFLGGKIGLTHHQKTTTSNFAVVPTFVLAADSNLYLSNTIVSGGADFGFDVCFCGNWSFVVQGAVIASCGPRAIAPIVIDPTVAGVSTLFLGNVGTELRFPVTAGIRYSF